MTSPSRGRAAPPDASGRRCPDCAARRDPEDPAARFCPACEAAVEAIRRGREPEAERRWAAAIGALPASGVGFYAHVGAVRVRADGTLVLAARAQVRRWVKRRYGDVLAPAAGGPVEIVALQDAARELAAANATERSS